MNVSAASEAGFGTASGVEAQLPRWQRWLLPAVIGAGGAQRDADGGTRLPRSVRDWVVDLVLVGFALLAGAGAAASDHHEVSTTIFVINVVAVLPSCMLLWVRRRHPIMVGWLTAGVSLVVDSACGAALVALLTVAVHCAPRRTLQLALLCALSGATDAAIYANGSYDYGRLAFWLVMTLAVVGFGSYVRARRELLLSLQERARRAESEQQLRVREAQLAERSRIAREMHDVLAHRISLLSVHAGALEFNPDASPRDIARAAAVIRVSAREAQEELREVIGVLRTGMAAEDVQPPQPRLADLERLIEESRGAGMEVSLSNALPEHPLSPILGRTVYRLIQEALTNARKHAPGQLVSVVIEGDPSAGVRVEVANQPRVGLADAGEATRPEAGDGAHLGAGVGLVGLTERVTLVGGELLTEALPGGGFRLVATLPWSHPEADNQEDA